MLNTWENTFNTSRNRRADAPESAQPQTTDENAKMPANADTRSVLDRLRDLTQNRSRGATEPSAGRRHVVAHFDAITEARSRRVTWQQIAKALAESGIRDEDGSEIGWSSLKNLYHAERYARSERRKRRSKKPKVAAQATSFRTGAPAPAAPVDAPGDEDDRPAGAFRVVPARSRT